MTGFMEGADPTAPGGMSIAPGGMSIAQLRLELAEKHGVPMSETKKFGLKFPPLIDLVVQGRLDRERELVDAIEHAKGMNLNEVALPDLSEYAEDFIAQDHDDFDDLMAELDALTGDEVVLPILPPQNRGPWADGIAPAKQPALFLGIPGTRDYIFDGHKGTGPSQAERWMSCTASLGAARAFLETLTPNQQAEFAGGSAAARQGTTAHAVAEVQARVLLDELTPEEADLALMELAVHPLAGEDYDEEMEGYVAEYIDLVKSYVDEGRTVLIEESVTATIPLLSVTDGEEDVYDITGSLDLGVMPTPEEPVLVVGDLKYGEGIDVDVDSNPQIRIYALGLLARIVEEYDGLPDWLTDIEYIIIQPRLGGIKTWTETVDDLLDWQENALSIALTEALGGQRAGAKFSPSPAVCQWCPARGGCPALLAERQEQASELFDVLIDNGDEFPETSTLSDPDLAKFYTQVRGLTSLAAELKEELQRRAYRGQQIPGYVLVNYSPPRHWTEDAEEQIKYEGALDAQYHDKVFTTKMVTPTQAEKLLGEAYAQVKELVVKPDKRPVIAPEGDRRSVWTGKAPEDMFADESGEAS